MNFPNVPNPYYCEASVWDLYDPCVQDYWATVAVAPVLIIIGYGIVCRDSDPIRSPHRGPIALEDDDIPRHRCSFIWRPAFLATISFTEFVSWLTIGTYAFATDNIQFAAIGVPILISLTWLYASAQPVFYPQGTAYVDLFMLYLVHLFIGVFFLGSSIFYHPTDPMTTLTFVGVVLNLAATLSCLAVVSTMPLQLPPKGPNSSLEEFASIFDRATFRWVDEIIKLGDKKVIVNDDVWDLSSYVRSGHASKAFDKERIASFSLFVDIVMVNLYDLFMDFGLTVITVVFSFGSPFFLRLILEEIDDPAPGARSRACILAFLAFFCALAKAEADGQHLFFGRRASARVRIQLMNAIHAKSLKRPPFLGAEEATKATTADSGKIINMAVNDVNAVSAIVASAYLLYGSPFELFFAGYLLYSLLGVASFAGYLVVIFAWLLQRRITNVTTSVQKGLLTTCDKRLSRTKELLGILIPTKFFSWEDHWVELISKARDTEVKWLNRMYLNKILGSLVWASAPVLVSLSCFLAYICQGNRLTPSIAFTTIAVVTMLRQPLNALPSAISQVYRAGVALHRVEEYLQEKEQDSKHFYQTANVCSEDDAVTIENGSFGWHNAPTSQRATEFAGSSAFFSMSNVSVRFPKGKLSLITGPIASGKTTLLLAILGELGLDKGKLYTDGAPLRYVAQTPWLEHKSIKENILFNNDWDEDRYKQVIECCALEQDLRQLDQGDLTIIGDRGHKLSGGQQARVALARAVYPKTGTLLLDDPISALDVATARFIVYKLFCGLLKDRTLIIVTHSVGLVEPVAHSITTLDHEGIQQSEVTEPTGRDYWGEDLEYSLDSKASEQSVVAAKKCPTILQDSDAGLLTYFKAASYWTWITYGVLLLCNQGMIVAEKIWLQNWGQAYQSDPGVSALQTGVTRLIGEQQALVVFPSPDTHPLYYVAVYAVIGCTTVFFNLASARMLNTACLRASCSLFERLLDNVVHATMHWLEQMPQGDLLNRFQVDTVTLDVKVIDSMSMCCVSAASVLMTALTIGVVFPSFLVPAAIISFCYYLIAARHLRISGQLSSLESKAASPIITSLTELLDGISTIRAFGAQEHLSKEFHKKIDVLVKMYYTMWMTTRWLLFRFEVLSSLVALMTTLFALSARVSAGVAGLCITSAMNLTLNVYFVCRFGTQVQIDLRAAKRVIQYLGIEQESTDSAVCNNVPKNWLETSPGESLVKFENVSIKYSDDLAPALDDITLDLKAGQRIGIVGRTGSGKSTLVKAMMRFTNPARGRIVVGGVNISEIDIRTLRSHITYIPQQAVLFSGTLRQNLDPYGVHGERCMEVLSNIVDKVGIRLPEGGLESWVDPGNPHFSEGEKQVYALARAVLNKQPVVILDEATSCIDAEKEQRMKEVIHSEFDGLLIAIAHRASTLQDFDHVFVIEKGKLIESGPPSSLKYMKEMIENERLKEPDVGGVPEGELI